MMIKKQANVYCECHNISINNHINKSKSIINHTYATVFQQRKSQLISSSRPVAVLGTGDPGRRPGRHICGGRQITWGAPRAVKKKLLPPPPPSTIAARGGIGPRIATGLGSWCTSNSGGLSGPAKPSLLV